MAKAKKAHKSEAERTANAHRKIQKQQNLKDASSSKKQPPRNKATQAGARKHPEPPMPAQHLEKPGTEKDMQRQPQFQAPDYKGSGKLEGFSAIVTGGDSGIGRAV